MTRSGNRLRVIGGWLSLVGDAIHQCQNSLSFRAVVERMKPPDFIEAAHTVESIEIARVACGERRRFKVASAQISIVELPRTLASEKMKPQPAPVSP
jgi:hypothetical protein